MWEAIRLRAVAEARYMLETKCTVRACAAKFGVSKSTVHKDVTERLLGIDPALCPRCAAGWARCSASICASGISAAGTRRAASTVKGGFGTKKRGTSPENADQMQTIFSYGLHFLLPKGE